MAQHPVMTNGSPIGSNPKEFYPAIMGMGSNDVVSALKMGDGEIVFFNNASGQAIIRSSTNGLCFFNGRFFFASPSRGPDQVADIYVSQIFGAKELNFEHAVPFEKEMKEDFVLAISPKRGHINLRPILQTEYQTSYSAMGTPLRSAVLDVEDGKLVLLFESFTGIKGKVVLDDQLNPILMAITEEKDSKKN